MYLLLTNIYRIDTTVSDQPECPFIGKPLKDILLTHVLLFHKMTM